MMKDLWDLRGYPLEETLTRHEERVARFRDIHAGERCVIIGNGPSLLRTDLTRLKNVPTFGLNKIFLHVDAMGFAPTYHVTVNPYVMAQDRDGIMSLPGPKFFSHAGIPLMPENDEVVFVRDIVRREFSPDLRRGWLLLHTVTFCAMQVACWMGFSEVVLVGVDHSYNAPCDPNRLVTAETEDPNHFHPNYFGPGTRWQLPDLEGSEEVYRMAREFFEANGRRIVDATVGGRLQVFEKADFHALFPEPDAVAS
ncbi:hypothetical protein [Pseudodesulfovibrio tunisiensis]|uniref:hypothetical protein n=1 Tax=Pseudodesulfovibrio tunisiensis TaxID=463192 RepID=UPI001FB539BB|nr:hypothetical protein [Pseudodesulfovibrio tunisiensis]